MNVCMFVYADEVELRDAGSSNLEAGAGGGGGASDPAAGLVLGLVDVTASVPRGRQPDSAHYEIIINQSTHDVTSRRQSSDDDDVTRRRRHVTVVTVQLVRTSRLHIL